jgi:hypothetical protein
MRSDDRNARRGCQCENSGSGTRGIVSGTSRTVIGTSGTVSGTSGTVSDRGEPGGGTLQPATGAIGTSIGTRGSYIGTPGSYIGTRGSYIGTCGTSIGTRGTSIGTRVSYIETRDTYSGTRDTYSGTIARRSENSENGCRISRNPNQFAEPAVSVWGTSARLTERTLDSEDASLLLYLSQTENEGLRARGNFSRVISGNREDALAVGGTSDVIAGLA